MTVTMVPLGCSVHSARLALPKPKRPGHRNFLGRVQEPPLRTCEQSPGLIDPWPLQPGPIAGLFAAEHVHLPLWGNGTSVWEGCLAVGKVDTFPGLEYAYIHQDQALVSSSNLLVNPNYGGALWLSL